MSDLPDLPRWRVESSRYVIDDPWLRVRADDCVTEEGVRIAPFFVTEHPDWVIVVAIDVDGQLLLLDQYRHGWGVTSRELPTGAIDSGDADPIAAGRRELLEETGYGGGDWRLVATLAPNPANQSNRCHIALASGVSKIAEPHDQPTERLRLLIKQRRRPDLPARTPHDASKRELKRRRTLRRPVPRHRRACLRRRSAFGRS